MRLFRTGLTAVALAVSFGGAAVAAPTFVVGLNEMRYQNFENLYRSTAACTASGACLIHDGNDPFGFNKVNTGIAGNVTAGDIFAGIINVSNVQRGGNDSYNSTNGTRFTGYFAHTVGTAYFDGSTAILPLAPGIDPFGILTGKEQFKFFANVGTFNAKNDISLQDSINLAIGQSLGTNLATNKGNIADFWGSFGIKSASDGYAYAKTNLGDVGSDPGSSTTALFALDTIATGLTYSAGTLNKVNAATETAVGGKISNTSSLLCSPSEIGNSWTPGTVGSLPAIGASCTDIVAQSLITGNGLFVGGGAIDLAGNGSFWQFNSVDPVQLNRAPEPGSLALMGAALAGLAVVRRRKSA